jgi:uncharacterized protein YndB with AHSA1/START domain
MERRIQKAVLVPAPLAAVWHAWTTAEGATTFFAPRANIELEIGGPYELLFDLAAPPGQQGGEGLRILSFLPPEMLSFEWNAPPEFPAVRAGARTWVVLQLEPVTDEQTLVALTHLGWRAGGEWDQVFDYFLRAWDIVLGRLSYRFAEKPLDWRAPYTPEAE